MWRADPSRQLNYPVIVSYSKYCDQDAIKSAKQANTCSLKNSKKRNPTPCRIINNNTSKQEDSILLQIAFRGVDILLLLYMLDKHLP